MDKLNCHVILFDSTHQALRAEQVLKQKRIDHAVINTPREFSADCGISLRIDPSASRAAREALEAAGVRFSDIVPYHTRFARSEDMNGTA